jgi:hypothetical protein
MSTLTVEKFDALCVEAKHILINSGAGAPSKYSVILKDYGMYRIGDRDFLNVGLTWHEKNNVVRSAKIQDGKVTDHYIIFPKGGHYFSAQIDPVTGKQIALYKNTSNGLEPKLDPKSGQILQQNYYTKYWPLPEKHLEYLKSVNFPFIDTIFCWAEKPYGTCIEFDMDMSIV